MRDPGVAAERTALAWARTDLAALALAALLTRLLLSGRATADVLTIGVCVTGCVATALLLTSRSRRSGTSARAVPASVHVSLNAVVVLLAAVTTLIAIGTGAFPHLSLRG